MNPSERRGRNRRWAVALASLGCCLSPALHATGSSFAAPDRAAMSAAIELRGIMSVGDVTRFRVCNAASNRGAWLALGERWGDVVISGYDAATGAVTIECAGEKLARTLPAAAISAEPVELASVVEPVPAPALPPSNTVPPVDIAAESRVHGIVRR